MNERSCDIDGMGGKNPPKKLVYILEKPNQKIPFRVSQWLFSVVIFYRST